MFLSARDYWFQTLFLKEIVKSRWLPKTLGSPNMVNYLREK